MVNKKVLIIEDQVPQREALAEMLRLRKFDVFSASSIAEARTLAKEHWEHLDVAVLDMRLERYPDAVGDNILVTGAAIGIEEKRRNSYFPPELLIYSAYAELDYYRLALELGVAAYLPKTEVAPRDVVEHVKVLALRHALSGANPVTIKRVARIAALSQSLPEAITRFCHEILQPEMEICLETQFVILLTERRKTRNCGDNAALPEEADQLYDNIQALAHGVVNPKEPFFVLDSDKLRLEPSDGEEVVRYSQQLNGAAFLPLSVSTDLKLSVGILSDPEGDPESPDSAQAMCRILAQYLKPTVLENVLNISSQWTELRITRYNTAKLCLFVGQELRDTLARDDAEPTEHPTTIEQVDEIANDLCDTGDMLARLEKAQKERPTSELISIEDAVSREWALLVPKEGKATNGLQIEGACEVVANRSDIEIVISRLLSWFAQRRSSTPFDVDQMVTVKCGTAGDLATVLFEDSSRRLNKRLREDMFAPFTQAVPIPFPGVRDTRDESNGSPSVGRYLPLYLAKMLVEGRYLGVLEDRSDDITEHAYGNRIVMQLPQLTGGE